VQGPEGVCTSCVAGRPGRGRGTLELGCTQLTVARAFLLRTHSARGLNPGVSQADDLSRPGPARRVCQSTTTHCALSTLTFCLVTAEGHTAPTFRVGLQLWQYNTPLYLKLTVQPKVGFYCFIFLRSQVRVLAHSAVRSGAVP
jgi:hypothetical protein